METNLNEPMHAQKIASSTPPVSASLGAGTRPWEKRMRDLYYSLKPLVPESLTFAIRRWRVRQQRRRFRSIWPIDPSCATPPNQWPGWPNNKRFALVLTHDVEWAGGQAKCLQLAQMEEQQGFRSAFYFVPRRYPDAPVLREKLRAMDFEVGVHGLYHDGKLYRSHAIFSQRAVLINQYIRAWNATGFRSPSMHHNLEWLHELEVQYDASTFDVDPFEPQSDGVGTIFPFMVKDAASGHQYVELPYTLPQDSTLFLLSEEKDASIWKHKLDWVAQHGGMALLITHPDYMTMNGELQSKRRYPISFYEDLLHHVKTTYAGQYWQALPGEVAQFVSGRMETTSQETHAIRQII